MIYKRDFLYRKKIIGGSIIGNVWDAGKNIIRSVSKMAIDKGKELLKLGADKAFAAGKEITKDLASKAVDFAKDEVSGLAERGTRTLVNKARAGAKHASSKLSPSARETINVLSTNPELKRVFADKTKQVLKKAPINDNSRAIISNLLAGSGVKRIR